jgi:hypothetical protein
MTTNTCSDADLGARLRIVYAELHSLIEENQQDNTFVTQVAVRDMRRIYTFLSHLMEEAVPSQVSRENDGANVVDERLGEPEERTDVHPLHSPLDMDR